MEEVACPEPCCFCGFPLQRKRSITATVLDVTGWRPVHHVVQRCGNRDCPRWRREVGYNFCQEGTMRCRKWFFEWSGATPMAFWFISGQCGVTVKYLRQLSRRLALQHLFRIGSPGALRRSTPGRLRRHDSSEGSAKDHAWMDSLALGASAKSSVASWKRPGTKASLRRYHVKQRTEYHGREDDVYLDDFMV